MQTYASQSAPSVSTSVFMSLRTVYAFDDYSFAEKSEIRKCRRSLYFVHSFFKTVLQFKVLDSYEFLSINFLFYNIMKF